MRPPIKHPSALLDALREQKEKAETNLRNLENQMRGVERAIDRARAKVEMADEMLEVAGASIQET